MAGTINPSIEQSLKQTFEPNFRHAIEQKMSRFKMTSALSPLVVEGNIHNISRIGSTELTETSGRNPLKTYDDPDYDNRKMSMRRFTKTFVIDRKDAQEAIKDPTSDLYRTLVEASNRQQDRVIAEAASADVLMGESNAAGSAITAAADGVITIDATAGLTYEKLTEGYQNFINNNVLYTDMGSSDLTLAVTGKEHSALMAEQKFIDNDFTNARPVDSGMMPKAYGMTVVAFAGSVSGATVSNPVLDETLDTNTNRACLLLAPEAIGYALRVESFDFTEKVEKYVDSSSITIVLQCNAIRLDGKLVQIVKTAI